MEKENGPIGMDGSKGTARTITETTIVPGGRAGMIEEMIVPDGRAGMIEERILPGGRTGMIKKTKMMTTGVMLGLEKEYAKTKMMTTGVMLGLEKEYAGVADVSCLAKVRWPTHPAVLEKGSFSQARSF